MNQEMLWSAIVKDMEGGKKMTRKEELYQQLTEVLTATDTDMSDLFDAKYSELVEVCYVETFPDFDDEGLHFYLPNTTKEDAKILSDIILSQGI